jgi:hypothetical protein
VHVPTPIVASLSAASVVLACGGEPAAVPAGPPASLPRPEYSLLSETGLYTDLPNQALAPSVRPFAPGFLLWADGAEKQRWIALPEAAAIDTSDMDHWGFPIGTRAWKQFSLDGVLLETRLIERYGPDPEDYWMGAFVWNQDQSDARFVEQGQADVLGTLHDAPAQDRCPACHNGEPGRLLGFSALQLGSAEAATPAQPEADWTLSGLWQERRLSAPPREASRFTPPGDATTASALGYLHANCGHCHNPRGSSWPDTQMVLRLDAESPSLEETRLFRSVVGQALQYYRADPGTLRVAPGDPAASALLQRMQVRGPKEQMPPLATEEIDAQGLEIVRRWIASLALGE